MDRTWLEEQLAAGRSITSIAEEAGRPLSTVAYWVNKHGLVSAHAARRAPKGPVARETLLELVEQGLSVRQIGAELGLSYGAVRHWLRRHDLETRPGRHRRQDERPDAIIHECPTHGWTTFSVVGVERRLLCGQCNVERVSARRRRAKAILVDEAGGRCRVCGYDRCRAALQFHHLDPSTKRFQIAEGGRVRGMDRLREEAGRCVLLCANCHAEVEAGLTRLPFPLPEAPERSRR
jgi:predicted transcriptional regulator